MPDDRIDAWRASALCKELDDEQCRTLAALTDVRELAAGEMLVREGSTDPNLYVVASGALSVVRNAGTERAVTLHTLSAGDLVDELGFLDGTPYYASKVALVPTRVVALPRDRLESLLDRHPAIVYRVMRAILRVTHAAQRRLAMQQSELANYIYKQHGRY